MANENTCSAEPKMKRFEQNDPNGAVQKFVKPDILCGEIHQISIWQPTVIIDSHMHIQSGHCSTKQFVQYQGPLAAIQTGLNFSRGFIEGSGALFGGLLTLFEWVILKPAKMVVDAVSDKPEKPKNPQESYLEKNALLELVTEQKKPTDEVANDFILERKGVIGGYFKNAENCKLYENAPYLFFSSVVMTMDMEYSHIDGYFGLKVYNPLYEKGKTIDVTNPSRYWTPVHGKWVETTGRDYDGGRTFVRLRNKTIQ